MCREELIDFSRYDISKDGTIISKFKNAKMTTCNTANGYIINTFRKVDGKQETFARHRVIWYYFNGSIPQGLQVGHKDSDKSNNSLNNLYLCTPKENMNNEITRHRLEMSYKNELRNEKISKSLKGHIVSEEQKKKQSIAMSGSNHPNYRKKRLKHSVIMKSKLRDNLGRWKKGTI